MKRKRWFQSLRRCRLRSLLVAAGLTIFVVIVLRNLWRSQSPLSHVVDEAPSGNIRLSATSPAARLREVRLAFHQSWSHYRRHAFGHDEMKPISERGTDWFDAPLGITVIDALSTLWIMGFTEEFREAVTWVTRNLNFADWPPWSTAAPSTFEFNIRVIGGLLSAYQLSRDRRLLNTAVDAADVMIDRAFDGGELHARCLPRKYFALSTLGRVILGVRTWWISLQSNSRTDSLFGSAEMPSILADVGTFSLELRSLSWETGNPKYASVARKVEDCISAHCGPKGCPRYWLADLGVPHGEIAGINTGGDSYYEYVFKTWFLMSRTPSGEVPELRSRWLATAKSLLDQSLLLPVSSQVWFVVTGNITGPVIDQLACFSGGLFAHSAAVIGDAAPDHLEAAQAIDDSCTRSGELMLSSLTPTRTLITASGPRIARDSDAMFELRPEVFESHFFLFCTTQNEHYRERSWALFTAMVKHLRLQTGAFAAASDVRRPRAPLVDRVQSYFFAETMKYIFLTFAPGGCQEYVNSGEWVFNTEAHPLRTITRNLR